jgi:hypothetical protein
MTIDTEIYTVVLFIGFLFFWIIAASFNFLALKHRKPGVPIWPIPFWKTSSLTDRGLRARKYAICLASVAILWLALGFVAGKWFFHFIP